MISRRDVLAGSVGALALSTTGSAGAWAQDTPGVTDQAITAGVLSVLTGPVALQGVPIANGIDAYFKARNDAGGIEGRKVEILKQDHQYNGQTANQIFAEMTPRVAIYADLFGTPIIAALQRRIKQAGVLVIPSTFGSQFYADPQLIIPFAPYTIQICNGIDYIVKEKNGKSLKWAVVSRHDNLGADGVAAFDYATKHYDLDVVTKQTYEPTDTDFTAQIQALKDAGANAIVLANTSAVTAQFVVGLTRLGVHAIWLGWQPSFDPGLAKNKDFMSIVAQDKFYIGSCLPAWSTQAPEMAKVREVRDKYYPDQVPDPYFTFGYIHGAMTNAVLEAAIKSGDLSRAGINAAVKNVGTTDLNGLLTNPVNFAEPPQKRFPRAVQIWEVSESDPSFQAPVTDYISGESAATYPMPEA
ncbi:ABC transporter substrate-binding protein [Rhodoligotrophos defluvii]|uniref:ABC transporter substrate-binding protein n=1 Tax=Rhodoligotrophos defluvii TaxID=2561934 RepID=UPI0014858DD5|nr:ABC transporter substrate-binding protein [Rhodoligotrophos defluvii]